MDSWICREFRLCGLRTEKRLVQFVMMFGTDIVGQSACSCAVLFCSCTFYFMTRPQYFSLPRVP